MPILLPLKEETIGNKWGAKWSPQNLQNIHAPMLFIQGNPSAHIFHEGQECRKDII